MDFKQAKTAATGFINHWHVEGALFSKGGDEAWQTLAFLDSLLRNPSELVANASESPQTFRQLQRAAARLFRLMHIAETEELEEWERENLRKLYIPKELYPWLAEFLTNPAAARPAKSTDTKQSKDKSHTFKRHNNRNYVIACAISKLCDRGLLLAGESEKRDGSAADAVAKAMFKLDLHPNSASGILDIWYEVTGSGCFCDTLPNEPWFPEKTSK